MSAARKPQGKKHMSPSKQDQLRETAVQAHDIYESHIQGLARKFKLTPEPTRTEINQSPLVLVIGNHSSGKSSFINHILDLEVQRTALAPMDDGFTLLSYGEGEELDGAAIVSNDSWPYQGLQSFGPGLVSHLVMKRRPSDILKALNIVDSPGMIDARIDPSAGVHDRGYDFLGVVRWFAERADVILLFFDPDNPGTTGETLKILNEALSDLDHKLELIMNKVDRFSSHRDFARGYGALCWNLARAIPRLDLPHINIIYLRGHDTPETHLPLEDFDNAREEVIEKVRNAPAKRVDNIVTHLYEYARLLRVHVQVIEVVRGQYSTMLWGSRAVILGIASLGLGLTGVIYTASPDSVSGCLSALILTVVISALIFFVSRVLLKRYEEELSQGLNTTFESAFGQELVLGTHSDDLRALWQQVKARTRLVVGSGSLSSLPKVRAKELEQLNHAITMLLPKLRAKIHPGQSELH
jgi:GTPase SAR1 family protein